jgi:hypothetical protein
MTTMKTFFNPWPAALLAALLGVDTTLHAQGSLTPPGAPAPTMKTLAQIEPRTPISSAPFTITVSGYAGISVYSLYTGNIIVKNSVSGNGANNYLTSGSQVVGPLITSCGTITNSNPRANFSY